MRFPQAMANGKCNTENGKWKRRRFYILISGLPREPVCLHDALSLREMAPLVSHQEPKRVEQTVNHHAGERRRDNCFRRVSVLQRLHLRQQFALMGDEAFDDSSVNRT